METNEQYFDCLCRTCMNKVEASTHNGTTIPQHQWLSIFDIFEECGALRIAELLSDAVPQIVVQPSDELPKKICTECLQQLLSVYRFQQMCLQSDKEMHELLSKEQTVFKTPVLEESINGETETNDADSQPLKDLAFSSTRQNIQQPSMQESRAEVTVQTIEPEAAQSSPADHLQDNSQLLEQCNDSQGEFEEFIKNEPIEDDTANNEYSDGDTMHLIISVTKDEVLPIELGDPQVNDAILAERRTTHAEDKPYECPYCPLRFSRKASSSRHKTIHEGLKPHMCSICGKKFRLKQELTNHKRIHSKEKPHKCDQCEKRFAQMLALKAHIRTHTGDKPFKCKYCQRGFATSYALGYHLRSHLGENIHRCKFCPLAFSSSAEMRLHLITHKNEDPMVRERNLKALQEEEAKLKLNSSKEISKGQSTEKLQQEKLCNKEIEQSPTGFTRSDHLTAHIRKHTGDKPYKCKYCEHAFAAFSTLQYHLRSHVGKNIHRCKFCPFAVSSYAELHLHLTSHKNEDQETRKGNLKALQEEEVKLKLKFSKEKSKGQSAEEQQQQKLSNKEIKEPPTDILAVQRITNADKPYECPYCPLRFNSKSGVSKHKAIHEEAKRHECDICGKKFRHKSVLKCHKLIHSKEKPYKCDFCEKRFVEMKQLKIHTRTHTGEKPFKCKYCERGFASHCILNKHLRTHLGKNIHRCKFCPLAYPSSAEMRLHLTSHKNEDPEVRERNMKALQEEEANLVLKFSKEKSKGQSTEEQQQQKLSKSKGQSTEEQQQQKLSNKEIEQPSTDRDEFEEFIKNEPIEDDKFSSIAMRTVCFQQSL